MDYYYFYYCLLYWHYHISGIDYVNDTGNDNDPIPPTSHLVKPAPLVSERATPWPDKRGQRTTPWQIYESHSKQIDDGSKLAMTAAATDSECNSSTPWQVDGGQADELLIVATVATE